MKYFRITFTFFITYGLLLTSCSKEDDTASYNEDKAMLSFGVVLNDLVSKKTDAKQTMSIPACSDDAPKYVEVVLSGPTNVGTMEDPLIVKMTPNQGNYDGDPGAEFLTEESKDLELIPGTYTLQYFAVYNGHPHNVDTDRMWVAPITGGNLAAFVPNPLPIDITLGAGVKRYVNVEVLCFEDRLVNEYGYLFFDIEDYRAMEYCFFANYCPPEGKHYPAAYSLDVWINGNILYSNVIHKEDQIGINNDGEYFAAPICIALPDLPQFEDDEDYIYYEVTLLDWKEVYGEVEPTVISGTLSRNDIEANFGPNNTMDFEHLRFGCEGVISPNQDDDDDGVPYEDDNCPGTYNSNQEDSDGDGFGDVCDMCPDQASAENTECSMSGDDCATAYVFGDVELRDLQYTGNNWGWGIEFDVDGDFEQAHFVGDNIYEFPVYAYAEQNDPSKGWEAGVLRVVPDGTDVRVQYILNPGVNIKESHIWFHESEWPAKRAPGQFNHNYTRGASEDEHKYSYSGDGSFYIIAHGKTCR